MKYAVCEEIVDDVLSNCYTIRAVGDTNPERFMVHGYFNTYKEACDFVRQLRVEGIEFFLPSILPVTDIPINDLNISVTEETVTSAFSSMVEQLSCK